MMLVAIGLCSLILIVLYVIYRYCFSPYQLLKRCGIKGPTPVPIVGNHLILKMNLAEISKYLYNTYEEPILGLYYGTRPTVYVKDPEMIKQITVSEFESFLDRPNKVKVIPEEYRIGGLAATTGDVWKRTRRNLTPAFSTLKMKRMVPLIKRSVDVLTERFQEVANTGQSINILEFYGNFTLESILAVAFGLIVDVQKGRPDELLKAASKVSAMKKDSTVFRENIVMHSIHPVFMPCLESFVHLLMRRRYASSWKTMQSIASKMIEAGKAKHLSAKPYKDILQLMIEASDDTRTNRETMDTRECPTCRPRDSGGHRLSAREILDNSVTLLFDETSKNALAHVSYLLAINPEIQMKLQSEIDRFFDENPDGTLYEAAQTIDYLDHTIQETLRLYPPAETISRLCVTSTVINGVHIPRGTHVHIPIKQLHYDPKYWNDPERFDPNRFSPKEKAGRPNNVHLPFGAGPRRCIGTRYALLEAKIALIELLKRFSFKQGPNTKVPLPVPDGFSTTPTEGIFVKVV